MAATKNARDIFLAALDRAPVDRAAYLDEACGGDAALRQRVEALLRAHDDPGAFLSEAKPGVSDVARESIEAPLRANDAAPLGAPPTGVSTSDDLGKDERVGAVLAGKYKLVEEIGEGGMGSVFMAQQTEPVKRAVAVKVIKAGMDSRAVLARFEAERQALAMMDHPNIAKVLDAGATDSGRPFFVMELVKGTPITRYCDEHRLTPRQRLELFVPVCQAIQHAHQKGIIHRDIKPSNVLVAMYDDKPVPKVIDFGVAKAAGQSLTDKTLMTGFGAVVGTPEYMSPEQASLNNLDIDTRSDVYSLGVLLYELLTGSTPVDRKSLGRAALLEVLRIVREVEAPRPSARLSSINTLPSVAANRATEPARLTRLMKGELDWLVMKALEKDRTRRYDTANGLARDIQRYLTDEVVEARPPSVGYRVSKFVRRHRGQVIAVSLVLLALVGGIVGTTLGLFEAWRQEKIARDETGKKENALQAEARDVKERDDALSLATVRLKERDEANNELTHRLGVNAMVLANDAYDIREFKLTAERLNKVPEEQRGWEWRYLKRQLNGAIFTLYGHSGAVTSVAFSPDGTRIVTGGGDHLQPAEAKVWDARTGMYLFDLKGLPSTTTGQLFVLNVAFSADSKRIVAAGRDDTARVYDAMTGALQLELQRHAGEEGIKCAAFSPDGTQIATGSKCWADNGGMLTLWDARTGKVLREWQADVVGVMRVAFSPDGARIATGGGDQAAKVWDARTGTLLLEAKGMMSYESSIAFSPDGTRLVAGRDDGTAKVIDARSGAVLLELKGRPLAARAAMQLGAGRGVLSVAFSPDGGRIAAAGGYTGGGGDDEAGASVYDARTGAELLELKGHTSMVRCVAFSPDGERIITGSMDGTAKVWDARTGTPRLELQGITSPIACAAFSTDGTSIVTGGGEFDMPGEVPPPGEAMVWDARTGKPKLALKGLKCRIVSVAISKDGTRVVAGGWDSQKTPGEAMVWDARTGEALFELRGSKEGVTSVAFSPDGDRIITGGGARLQNVGKEARVWDARTGTMLLDLSPTLREGEGRSRPDIVARVSVAFSPDGKRYIVVGGLTEGVTIRDAQTGATLHDLKVGNGVPLCAAFSPDSARFATGNSNKTVTIWDTETGKVLLELKGHTSNVNSVAFSPDGKRIVTGSHDRTAKVWDARTGVILAELKGHAGPVVSVSFSADGTRILTAGPLEVFVWDAPIPRQVELMGHTARIAGATFSPDGTRIATGSDDKTVKIWDARTGDLLRELKGFKLFAHRLAFNADGSLIATGGAEPTAKVWDVATGSERAEFKTGQLTSVAFAIDGTRIVTESPDWITKLWDIKTGKELQGEPIPETAPSGRISADHRLFAYLNWERAAVVPLVPDENEIAYRKLLTQPKLSRYRTGYLAARMAKDDFAAAFYLNLIPPDEHKALVVQADADALKPLSNLAEEYAKAMDFEKAAPLQIEILNITRAKLGPEDPDTILAAETLGRIYVRIGDFEKAIPLLEDIVKHQKTNSGRREKRPPGIDWELVFETGATEELALAYVEVGRLPEAIALLEEEATAKKVWVGDQLLDAYEMAGEHAKIVAVCLKQLAEIRKSNPNKYPPGYAQQLANTLARLGRAYLGLHQWSEAEAHLRECVAVNEKNWPDVWKTFDAQAMLGAAFLGQKKYSEAEPLLLKGYEGLKQREKSIPQSAQMAFGSRHGVARLPRIPDALDRLIELYTAIDKPDKVKKWRAERAKYPDPAPTPREKK